MFVKDNSYAAIHSYFQEKLSSVFSLREIRFLTNAFVRKRLGLSEGDLLLTQNIQFSESDLLYFRDKIKRLLNGEPFQYLLGSTFFHSVEIEVNENALIPRPETEELVEWILNELPESSCALLDIGTGTGCIPLAIAFNRPKDEVFGCDISEQALALAKHNNTSLGLSVNFFQADCLNWKENDFLLNNNWDVIVSNPPYIPEKEKEMMAKHVTEFEPAQALFVPNDDAILFYRSIGELAKKSLKKSGKLMVEIHEQFEKEVVSCFQKIGFQSIEVRKDLQGKPRMIKATLE